MDSSIGNRLPISERSAEAAVQRQGGHLERRRSEDQHPRHVQSAIPEGQLFWCPCHGWSRSDQLYRRTPSRRSDAAAQRDCLRRLDLSVERKLERWSVFRSRISDHSRREERRALRRKSAGHGTALAGESTFVVSSRLRDFLCGQIRERKPARAQSELLGIVGRLQVLALAIILLPIVTDSTGCASKGTVMRLIRRWRKSGCTNLELPTQVGNRSYRFSTARH